MEQFPRHPLNAITNNNPMSMLEALIPFVDYPMKLPLALLIKANEIMLIMRAFQSLDYLSRIGLHNPSKDPMDMLGSLTGMSPEMLKMMMSVLNNSDAAGNADLLSSLMGGGQPPPDVSSLFSNLQADSPPNTASTFANDTPPSPEPSTYSTPPDESSSFDDRIQQILSEYDMMQAAELDQTHTSSSTA
ncbi:MAG: hypothetical protein PUC55_11565 [Lachnospiraceae bacterium]|nr:hypothetical protein [Lachnospiraceae bacterium]